MRRTSALAFTCAEPTGSRACRPPIVPDARIGFIPRNQVMFKGNWMGMCGTGSYDLEVPEQFVPADMTMELFGARHKRGRAGFGIGLRA
jgi:hypothetical protein